jgi:hypothetical protein
MERMAQQDNKEKPDKKEITAQQDKKERPVPTGDKDRPVPVPRAHRVQWVQPDPQPARGQQGRPDNEVQLGRRV